MKNIYRVKIMNIYSDDDNDSFWRKAAINNVYEEGEDLENPNFVVKYFDEIKEAYCDY